MQKSMHDELPIASLHEKLYIQYRAIGDIDEQRYPYTVSN